MYFKQKVCNEWNANVGIAHQLKILFDPIIHTEKSEPRYRVYFHEKIATVFCITMNGFTLCNGVDSVFENSRVSNCSMAQEVMKVRLLNCYDEHTYNK